MYNCSFCKNLFDTVEKLFIHLKHQHMIKENCMIQCHQDGCLSSFSNLYTYKKHIYNCHKISINEPHCINNKITTVPVEQNETNNSFVQTNLHNDLDSFINTFDIEESTKKIYESSFQFVSKLFQTTYLSNKVIQEIITDIEMLITQVIGHELEKCLQSNSNLSKLLEVTSKPFKNIKTEYLFIKQLQNKNVYATPLKFTINNTIASRPTKGVPTLMTNISYGTIMPIKFQIQKFFEAPNILNETLKYQNQLLLNDEKLINFVQGKLWKNKISLYKTDVCIPYFVYYDDFETGDPLSSRAGKQSIGGFYYTFPTLPKKFSSLEYVFIAMLIKSRDLKKFGNSQSLWKLVEELKELEEDGLQFEIDGKITKVRFLLGLITGDNLGLNTILGFAKSFTHSYFCRFCLINKNNINNSNDFNFNLRDRLNYNQSISDGYTASGVFENSIFNNIPSFHVVENYCVDIMHDVFEGVIKFGLIKSLNYFILEKKYFSLEQLNSRIQNFDYGEINIRNRPSPIKLVHLKNETLSATARQSECLIHFLICIIWGLVPASDKIFIYIRTLQDLVELVLKDSFSETDLKHLDNKIDLHNNMYIKLFGNLKPKHHFLFHYTDIIKQSGPLRSYWCMRFEAKHQQAKQYCNVSKSRINLPLSIGKKFALIFATTLLNNAHVSAIYNEKEDLIRLKEKFYMKHISLPSFVEAKRLLISLEFKGRPFKINYYLYENAELLKILNFIKYDENIMVIAQLIKIQKYDKKNGLFFVGEMLNKYKWLILDDSIARPFHLHTLPDASIIFLPGFM